ncbi:MAG: disulfide bond formation protein B [Elstera sp.]
MASYRSRSRLMPLVALPPLYSGAALAMALASQFWGGLQPCILCVYQRWPHAIALGLGLLAIMLVRNGLTRSARALTYLAGVALLITAGIGAFHMGVEWHWWEGTASCGSTLGAGQSVDQLRAALLATPVVRCDEVPWSFLGLSMAGYNFIFSGLMGIIVLIRTAQSKA